MDDDLLKEHAEALRLNAEASIRHAESIDRLLESLPVVTKLMEKNEQVRELKKQKVAVKKAATEFIQKLGKANQC